MPKKKQHNDYGTKVPRHEIEALALTLLPDIQIYFETEQGQREFAEWEKEQNNITNKE